MFCFHCIFRNHGYEMRNGEWRLPGQKKSASATPGLAILSLQLGFTKKGLQFCLYNLEHKITVLAALSLKLGTTKKKGEPLSLNLPLQPLVWQFHLYNLASQKQHVLRFCLYNLGHKTLVWQLCPYNLGQRKNGTPSLAVLSA